MTTESAFNTNPQPRTFAPSKDDVLQNLMYFFGAPVSPEKLKDYSEHHAMTCARRPARTQHAPSSSSSCSTRARARARNLSPRPCSFVRRPFSGCARAPRLANAPRARAPASSHPPPGSTAG